MSQYYIQNRRPVGNCVLWWALGNCGYTADLDLAQKYSEEEALRIVKGRPDIDSAWPCDDIDRLAVRHFDHQKFRDLQPLRALAGTDQKQADAQNTAQVANKE